MNIDDAMRIWGNRQLDKSVSIALYGGVRFIDTPDEIDARDTLYTSLAI